MFEAMKSDEMFSNAGADTLQAMARFVASRKDWRHAFRMRLYSKVDPLPEGVRAFWCAFGSDGLARVAEIRRRG